MEESSKPRVIVTGGVGFVGRHFVQFLVKNKLASHIRVADKVPPITAWLNDAQKLLTANRLMMNVDQGHNQELYKQVEFLQVNLADATAAERVFRDDKGVYDYVFNLAGETKYGQSDEVYRERVYGVSMNCAHLAAKYGVKRYVEVSTAQVYNSDKGISSEGSKLDPWTLIAKHKLHAERAMAEIAGLNFVVVRPSIIYGVGDKVGLTPRLIIGAVYRQLKEKMTLLWTKDLKMNTVHVCDVCRALWHVRDHGQNGEVFNLADKSDTSQGLISSMVSSLFGINHGYYGSVISNIAKLHMSDAVEESNEKHLAPWSDACVADSIANTPLSPYIDKELLYNRHLHVNGSKIESTGFHYEVPMISEDLLKEVVEDYIASGLFPPSLFPRKE